MNVHPEQRDGEVWIVNAPKDAWNLCFRWQTARAGTVAYDVDGQPVPGAVPVFAQRDELVKGGVDPNHARP